MENINDSIKIEVDDSCRLKVKDEIAEAEELLVNQCDFHKQNV